MKKINLIFMCFVNILILISCQITTFKLKLPDIVTSQRHWLGQTEGNLGESEKIRAKVLDLVDDNENITLQISFTKIGYMIVDVDVVAQNLDFFEGITRNGEITDECVNIATISITSCGSMTLEGQRLGINRVLENIQIEIQ